MTKGELADGVSNGASAIGGGAAKKQKKKKGGSKGQFTREELTGSVRDCEEAGRTRLLAKWERYGQAKVAVKCESEEELVAAYKAAKQRGLPAHVVVDAGRTQIAPNTRTVLAVGPAPVEEVDNVTGRFKLL